ncbi:response regulator [Geobacter benzoatilyticus]|uniref:Response regulator transcription factor n=1 Tax=Geobacter benzoatilyticus TaxID=2815309 RepID=A0ABX7Q254_9BACT|nr:response regulator transcription factor [Geobacter benzoatilyticus]QSV45492.1 response regulator transcription factor [Geobacter benzoatilyticus]
MDEKRQRLIFLVDDDAKLRKLLVKFLKEHGFVLREFSDGSMVTAAIEAEEPEAVILDIMLPGESGLDILRRIRQESAVPVIMLTAKGEDEDRILGLELGSDDYLPKPFNPRELLARLNAIMRRAASAQDVKVLSTDTMEVAGLLLNRNRRTVSSGGTELPLSATEFKLLEALMSRPNMILSRDELLNYARGKDFGPFDRSIDVHIGKLRTKIESLPGAKKCIKTVWGSGYMLEDRP